MNWRVVAHKDIKKKHVPLLKRAGLIDDFEDIIKILKNTPYEQVRNNRVLQPKEKKMYSMRINGQHRVVYTIDKKAKQVTLWSAWLHFEIGMPR